MAQEHTRGRADLLQALIPASPLSVAELRAFDLFLSRLSKEQRAEFLTTRPGWPAYRDGSRNMHFIRENRFFTVSGKNVPTTSAYYDLNPVHAIQWWHPIYRIYFGSGRNVLDVNNGRWLCTFFPNDELCRETPVFDLMLAQKLLLEGSVFGLNMACAVAAAAFDVYVEDGVFGALRF